MPFIRPDAREAFWFFLVALPVYTAILFALTPAHAETKVATASRPTVQAHIVARPMLKSHLPHDIIPQLLTSALEGGSTYWLMGMRLVYAGGRHGPRYWYANVTNFERYDWSVMVGYAGQWERYYNSDFHRGFEQLFKEEPVVYLRILDGKWTDADADRWLQYAVFGAIQFNGPSVEDCEQ